MHLNYYFVKKNHLAETRTLSQAPFNFWDNQSHYNDSKNKSR